MSLCVIISQWVRRTISGHSLTKGGYSSFRSVMTYGISNQPVWHHSIHRVVRKALRPNLYHPHVGIRARITEILKLNIGHIQLGKYSAVIIVSCMTGNTQTPVYQFARRQCNFRSAPTIGLLSIPCQMVLPVFHHGHNQILINGGVSSQVALVSFILQVRVWLQFVTDLISENNPLKGTKNAHYRGVYVCRLVHGGTLYSKYLQKFEIKFDIWVRYEGKMQHSLSKSQFRLKNLSQI